MSAVAEKPKISKPTAEKRYVSQRDELLLILERERDRLNPTTGERIETQLGKRLQFDGGELVIPAKGNVRGAPGGVARLPRQYVIDHLEGKGEPGDDDYVEPHPLFGNREEGFVLLPTPVPPLSEDEREYIVGLAIAGDVDGLQTLLDEERDGWERPELFDLVTATLEKVRAAAAPPPAA